MESVEAATGIEPETISLTYAYYMLLIFIAYKFYRNLPEFYDSSWWAALKNQTIRATFWIGFIDNLDSCFRW